MLNKVGYIDQWQNFCEISGEKVGYKDYNGDIFDENFLKIGYIHDDDIYNMNYKKVGYKDQYYNIYDMNYKKIAYIYTNDGIYSDYTLTQLKIILFGVYNTCK